MVLLIDVVGICNEVSDVQTIHAKSTGIELKKREITLVDESNTGVSIFSSLVLLLLKILL